jgi:hypothetical protein
MTYTTHGHHIPGTVKDDVHVLSVMRCGGPRVCEQCKDEAVAELPHDSIASADLRGDLAALAEFTDIAKGQHPSGLPIQWCRQPVINHEFIVFEDTPDGIYNTRKWLALNGVDSVYWGGLGVDTPRLQFTDIEARDSVRTALPGNYIVKFTSVPWTPEGIPPSDLRIKFRVFDPSNFEDQFEPSSQFAPAPWLFDDNNVS